MPPVNSKLPAIRLLALSGAMALSTAFGQNLEPAPANAKPPKPANPALIEVADAPGLPAVLLIGDSISMAYTIPVREQLKGAANVHRPLENCGDTARGLERLDKWLGDRKWDVIHFNFGLHDLKYLDANGKYVAPEGGRQVAPPDVYRQRLLEVTKRLQATGAKVIFATTTPVPEGTQGRVAGDEVAYNKVAVEVMKECGIPVNDLCAYVLLQQKKLPPLPLSAKPGPPQKPMTRPGEVQLPFNVHFTPEGSNQLAALVTASIKKELPAPK